MNNSNIEMGRKSDMLSMFLTSYVRMRNVLKNPFDQRPNKKISSSSQRSSRRSKQRRSHSADGKRRSLKPRTRHRDALTPRFLHADALLCVDWFGTLVRQLVIVTQRSKSKYGNVHNCSNIACVSKRCFHALLFTYYIYTPHLVSK